MADMDAPVNGSATEPTGDAGTDQSVGTSETTATESTDQNVLDFRTLFGDYANNESIKKFKSPADLAKSYIELERMIGKRRLPIPEKPEEYEEVLKTLGYPETPDAYPTPDEYKELLGEEGLNMLKQLAHASGMLPNQFEKFLENYVNSINGILEQQQAQVQQMAQAAIEHLQKEWGPKFDENLKRAQAAFNKLPDHVRNKIEASGLGNDPDFIKFMTEISNYLLEGGAKFSTTMTPADAREELKRIVGDRGSPYYDKHHPEHAAAVERVRQLYEILEGENG